MALVFLMPILPIPAAGENRLIRVNGNALVVRGRHPRPTLHQSWIAASDIMQYFPEIESRGDGFFLRRTIQLTIRDLHSYDAMLFELYDSAAVTVETIEFRVNDLRKLRDRARALAVRAAEEKVQLVANAMKRRVGRVMDVRVETGGGTLLRKRGQFLQDDAARMQTQNVAFSPSDASNTGAELFKVPITANVEVEYEILE